MYVAPADEQAEAAGGGAAAIAVAVALLPLAFIAARVLLAQAGP